MIAPASLSDADDVNGGLYEQDLPMGTPVDASTLAETTELEQQFAACYNAGDMPRLLATLSDGIIAASMEDLIDGDLHEVFSVTPVPLNVDEMIALFPLRDARRLPDGRVGATVDWATGADLESVSETNFRIYRQIEGIWVIDGENAVLN